MSIFDFIGNIFKPAADLVDNISTTDEERLQLRNEFKKLENQATAKILELEKTKIEALSRVEVAEANSKHWIRANWRPITALTLVGLIVAGSMGWATVPVEIYNLSTVFLGGYGVGRSFEKAKGGK
jgi:hypothetical protein